jgi:hypothetical protein
MYLNYFFLTMNYLKLFNIIYAVENWKTPKGYALEQNNNKKY